MNRADESIAAYKKGLELDPKQEQAALGLGWAYSYTKKYDEAIKAYEQAIQIDAKEATPDATIGIAWSYFFKRDMAQARAFADKATAAGRNGALVKENVEKYEKAVASGASATEAEMEKAREQQQAYEQQIQAARAGEQRRPLAQPADADQGRAAAGRGRRCRRGPRARRHDADRPQLRRADRGDERARRARAGGEGRASEHRRHAAPAGLHGAGRQRNGRAARRGDEGRRLPSAPYATRARRSRTRRPSRCGPRPRLDPALRARPPAAMRFCSTRKPQPLDEQRAAARAARVLPAAHRPGQVAGVDEAQALRARRSRPRAAASPPRCRRRPGHLVVLVERGHVPRDVGRDRDQEARDVRAAPRRESLKPGTTSVTISTQKPCSCSARIVHSTRSSVPPSSR